MKSLLAVTLAAALAVACSQSEQRPADSAPAQPAAEPASPAASAPAEAAGQPAGSPAPAAPRTAAAPSSAAPAAAPPAATKPEPAPPPAFREVTIPAGTTLSVSVLSNLASNTSKVEDVVKAALANPLVIDGVTVVPKGAEIRGVVSDAKQSGRVKGKASIGLAFDRLTVRGETHQIETAPVVLEAQDKKSDDVKKGGIGAGLGAVVGGIAGGGTGAAIGAVAGGAGAVLGTKGREIEVPAGTVVNVLLQSPLTLKVPNKQAQ